MYYVGIDMGGMSIKAGICDSEGKLYMKRSVPTRGDAGADAIIHDMVDNYRALVKEFGISEDDVEYVGIASPGSVDLEKGEIVYANNLPFLHYPIVQKFMEFSGGKKVFIENDANAAAKGEAVCGAAKGCSEAVFITLGTGVGGGIIINRKIYSGFNYAGAEIGHMVIEHKGKQCTCGRRGCFEAYSSATALIKATQEKMLQHKDSALWKFAPGLEDVNGKTAFDAAKMGDKAASEVIDEFIRYFACGIVNIINLFQPEVLCIGGGLSNEGDALFVPLMEIVGQEQYSRHSDKKTEIRIASLGNNAGMIGAAMLGI